MLTQQEMQTLANQAFGMVPNGEVEVLITSSTRALSRIADNAITQNVSSEDTSISIRVILDGRSGKVETNITSPDAVRAATKRAIDAARLTKPDPEELPLQGPQTFQANEKFDESTMTMGPEQRAEYVIMLAEACKRENLSAAGIVANGGSAMGLFTNRGLVAYHRSSEFEFSATVFDGDISGWSRGAHYDYRKVNVETLITRAVEKCKAGRNPIEVHAGKYTVVLEHDAVAEFPLFLTYMALGARTLQERTSCLAGKIGQQVLGANITITDDPFHPDLAAIPFDFEGTPKKTMTIFKEGVFLGPVHDRRTAKKEGVESTGHGLPAPNPYGPMAWNLCIVPGDSSLEEMIASTERGILVTHFHYVNIVNPADLLLTGMTRDGTYLIENGKITHAIKNLRFTESVLKVLNNVEAMSKDVKVGEGFFGGGFVIPAMKVKDFTFSSETSF